MFPQSGHCKSRRRHSNIEAASLVRGTLCSAATVTGAAIRRRPRGRGCSLAAASYGGGGGSATTLLPTY